MNKFFATTPIYYVNDAPHIGHTYTTVAADVITRFYKQKGYDARLLTGTDEHGAKIAEAAAKHGKAPQEYADEISEKFKTAWDSLNIDYARFIRTTDEDHVKTAREFFQKLYDKGAIDPKPRLYKGLYCVGHEKFMSKEELVDGLCPDHQTKPVEHSEENYYFKLSGYKKDLEQLISSDEIKIRPQSRKNEILGKLKTGLEDISISRASMEWGIPLPFDKGHTAYVWIEALINYYTYGSQENLWPADLHLMAKDILWFHALIWPAILLAIGEKLPKEIFAHGFFTINGQKMSKTIGNVISPSQLIEKYGVDGTRYLLLAAFPFGEDGDFSWEELDKLYNANLANGLGNLVARVAKLAEKVNFEVTQTTEIFDPLVEEKLTEFKFNEALATIWQDIAALDKKINEIQPWKLEETKLKEFLSSSAIKIRSIALSLTPFMPETAEKILKQFSDQIKSGSPLFPRK
ncbi:methionine--tRNA ligase [Candidatus Daviesbacteria bacterium]|nr:methionine--tRNA ligase [Candidatus Daviesbacteria bacterium]